MTYCFSPTSAQSSPRRCVRKLLVPTLLSIFGCNEATGVDVAGPDGNVVRPAPSLSTTPPILRAPQPTAVAPTAGGGTGGSSPTTSTGGATQTGGNGNTGGTSPTVPTFPLPPPLSKLCGDGVVGAFEECDDGGDHESFDTCSHHCRVTDARLGAPAKPAGAPRLDLERRLSRGRHAVAGSAEGFAVAFTEERPAEPPLVRLGVYGMPGPAPAMGLPFENDPLTLVDVSAGASSPVFADPVVATLPDGAYAVTWTGYGEDGLAINAQRVARNGAGQFAVASEKPVTVAAGLGVGAADAIWTGEELVVAWTDNSDPETAPDLRVATLSESLSLRSNDVLTATAEVEGDVALATLGTKWAAAWRSTAEDPSGESDDLEVVRVKEQTTGIEWTVGLPDTNGTLRPFYPGPEGERPALVAIDAERLAVAFTAATEQGGPTRVYWAVLDVLYPESIPVQPLTDTVTGDESEPAIAAAGTTLGITWRVRTNAAHEDVWLRTVDLIDEAGKPALFVRDPLLLPRSTESNAGDQRTPAIAGLPYPYQDPTNAERGAFAFAWTDFGTGLDPNVPRPDVRVQFAPLPLRRLPLIADCSAAAPCASGEGFCSGAPGECGAGLVCADRGRQFGYADGFTVCVAPTCTDGVANGNEVGIDCGGGCGRCSPSDIPAREANGVVALEAENAWRLSGKDPSWVLQRSETASGGAYLAALPDINRYSDPPTATTARADFPVLFSQAGTYRVWVRGLAGGSTVGTSDSVNVGLNGVVATTADRITGFPATWSWRSQTSDGPVPTLTIATPGLYTVNVWYREDGIWFDKLLLQTAATTPTNFGPPETARSQVHLGSGVGEHTCVIVIGGAVWCWGGNASGQHGDGTQDDHWAPVRADLNQRALHVGTGWQHTCAILEDRGVWCWGNNSDGQLGDGSNTSSFAPVAVQAAAGAPLANAVALAVGGYHSCALTSDGRVWCWGLNQHGQLGNGTTVKSNRAVLVESAPGVALNGVTQLATGGWHQCAVLGSGQLACWGEGRDGQLGDGTGQSKQRAVTLAGLSSVTAIGLGEFHSCAVAAGALRCWGSNQYGQLGVSPATVAQALSPRAGPAVTQVSAISAGYDRTCALRSNGAVTCWGDNSVGQLGDGTFEGIGPTTVTGLTAAALAGGGVHTCALTTEGAVACWGYNGAAQLGVGDRLDRGAPAYVIGLGDDWY
jgi:alpha-tubulin suppressor-like RCC1 family protein